MNYNIVVTESFKKETRWLSKKHRSIKNDVDELVTALEKDPRIGIPLEKNCYKVRLAITSKGKGKSGGARVITWVKIIANTVYLLSIYDKTEKENVSDKELDLILKHAGLQ